VNYVKKAATYFIIALFISAMVYAINRNTESALFIFSLMMFLLSAALEIDAKNSWSRAFSTIAFVLFMLSLFFYKPAECAIAGLGCLAVASADEWLLDTGRSSKLREGWVIVRPVIFVAIIALAAVVVVWAINK